MNSQPNELIIFTLSLLGNRKLTSIRRVCRKWKDLIENKILFKSTIPTLHMCILTKDYYHVSKHYLTYTYGTITFSDTLQQSAKDYYGGLCIYTGALAFTGPIGQGKSMKIMSGESLFICSALLGHLEVVQHLLTNTSSDLSSLFQQQILPTNFEKNLALQYAAKNGHLNVVKYLIKQGANIHADNDIALTMSVAYGQLEIIKYLVSLGMDINATTTNCLLSSAEKGHLNVMKYFIEQIPDLNKIKSILNRALDHSAVAGQLDVVKYLVSIGADIHANHDNALISSARNDRLDMVKYLITQGANIHADHDTALQLSAMHHHLEVVKYLINNGANISALSNTSRIWYMLQTKLLKN